MTDPPRQAPPRIAIVGGGISGLAAAQRLAQLVPQAELALFEASDRVGGVLDTAQIDGFLIERSADNFLTEPPAAADLCRQLGLSDQLIATDETRRRAFVVRDGKLLPIPDGFYLMSPRKLLPFLTSPALSWPAKLRLLAEPFVPRKTSAQSQCEGSESVPAEDESVASFARRRLGREAYERLVQPLVAGIYTADPERLSMAATMPQFVEYERKHGSLLRATLWSRRPGPRRTGHFSDPNTSRPNSDASQHASGARYGLFVAPRDGMTSLVSAVAATLPAGTIRLNAPISSITRMPDNVWLLDFGLRIADCGLEDINPQSAARLSSPKPIRNPQSFDALVLATPAYVTAQLLNAIDPELAAELAAIPYAGCAVVSFGIARRQIDHDLKGFGLIVPHEEHRQIIAASFASQKFPSRAPQGSVLIRVFIGGALQPDLLQLADPDLRQLALDELASLLHITGDPQVTDIARWPASMPQYHVGHLNRVARIEQLAAGVPNLALAGNAYHGVGIPHCIASGHAAAERIARVLRHRKTDA